MNKKYSLEELLKIEDGTVKAKCPAKYIKKKFTCCYDSDCDECWKSFLAYNALKESLEIMDSLCEYVSDSPCGCDACGFADDCEYDEEGNQICTYSKHKALVKEVFGMYNLAEDEV